MDKLRLVVDNEDKEINVWCLNTPANPYCLIAKTQEELFKYILQAKDKNISWNIFPTKIMNSQFKEIMGRITPHKVEVYIKYNAY